MTPPFSVRTTPRFDRLAKALTHPDFPSRYDRARAILADDPYNRTRAHHIKKLEGMPVGTASGASPSVATAFATTSTARRSCSSTAASAARTPITEAPSLT